MASVKGAYQVNTTSPSCFGPILPPPRYPEYSSLQSRLDSYAGWPQRVVGVSPASLAASGFFYIGSADRVRCFQCGVTLRNWEPEDDPATEHVTWSPACPVALLPPGLDSQTGFRDVQAPPESVRDGGNGGRVAVSQNESTSRNFEELGVSLTGSDLHAESPLATVHTGVVHISDAPVSRGEEAVSRGEEAVSRGEEAVSTAAGLEPPSVLAVLELGCSRDAVDRVRERRRRLQGTDFPDAASLLTAVMELGEVQSHTRSGHASSPEATQPPADVDLAEAASYSSDAAVSMLQSSVASSNDRPDAVMNATVAGADASSLPLSIGAIQARGRQCGFRQCKVCGQGEVTVTFLPCGHLIAFSDCAQKSQTCPRCGRTILGTVRTYFA